MATQYTAGLTVGQVLTAATMNSIGAAWETYTPTWTAATTNPAIGNGFIAGRYVQIQKLVHAQIAITMGSTTTYGSGVYYFGLPITSKSAYYNFAALGVGTVFDVSTANAYVVSANYQTGATGYVSLRFTGGGNGDVTNTAPYTFATNDIITLNVTYEAA
jgi:hypothetical protein